MLQSLSEWQEFEIHGIDGLLGRPKDILLKEGPWTIEYLTIQGRSGLEMFVSAKEINSVDGERKIITVAVASDETTDRPTESGGMKRLQRVSGLLGRPVFVGDQELGVILDFVLGEDSFFVEALRIQKRSGLPAEPYLYNMKRVKKISHDGTVQLMDRDPMDFDTPATYWDPYRREAELSKNRELR